MATIRDKRGHWTGSHFATAVKVSSHSMYERELDGERNSVLWSPVSVTPPAFLGESRVRPVSRPLLAEGEPGSELPPDGERPKPLAGSP